MVLFFSLVPRVLACVSGRFCQGPKPCYHFLFLQSARGVVDTAENVSQLQQIQPHFPQISYTLQDTLSHILVVVQYELLP
jgi:hypothetical protein